MCVAVCMCVAVSSPLVLPVCSEEQWQEVMAAVGCESNQLRDERYDQVIHMVTAASGAEPFYQLSNNSSRSEGLESARLNDSRAAHVSGQSSGACIYAFPGVWVDARTSAFHVVSFVALLLFCYATINYSSFAKVFWMIEVVFVSGILFTP